MEIRLAQLIVRITTTIIPTRVVVMISEAGKPAFANSIAATGVPKMISEAPIA